MRYPDPPGSLAAARRQSRSDGRRRIVDTITEHAPHAGFGLEPLLRSSDGGSVRWRFEPHDQTASLCVVRTAFVDST